MHFLEWKNVWISIKTSLKFASKVRIYNIPAMVQTMAWSRPGDKPLYELIIYWHTHIYIYIYICAIRPQWVNYLWPSFAESLKIHISFPLTFLLSCDFTHDLVLSYNCIPVSEALTPHSVPAFTGWDGAPGVGVGVGVGVGGLEAGLSQYAAICNITLINLNSREISYVKNLFGQSFCNVAHTNLVILRSSVQNYKTIGLLQWM